MQRFSAHLKYGPMRGEQAGGAIKLGATVLEESSSRGTVVASESRARLVIFNPSSSNGERRINHGASNKRPNSRERHSSITGTWLSRLSQGKAQHRGVV